MKLNFNEVQGFPVPAKLYQLINQSLAGTSVPNNAFTAITLNFRDPDYSADAGGYHPVEIRMEKQNELWQLVYITDFSYQGGPFPELVKEIDVCFISKQVFNLFIGWLQNRNAKELLTLFVNNFIEYYINDCYQVSVSFD
ncbi:MULTISPECIES: DUF2787 domain-containing protein [Gammaproteobacteria]|jgi:hypothetical protein|uniref:DUF2787 domain-containing protein n=1 Tax=Gammaproteobacteria TaxID=1236 RepID=UPI00056B6F52|nr:MULTISPECIES: DUF2787 domain-containing protein [Pseudoalteromonas]MAY57595.1 DUF2787 domain-containing protein [Pseudoalteromonas sp.]MDN3410736.1 DUF2787 domain-containing protein [Pseudoalteromonas sp. APC 3894]MDN3418050.1 DUF2787 domain-containing protein [Pseudoalteromonas sp. APC 3227]MDN3421758.1 DUF2787 domain-containing protein [Pseudoalteromonas sp. APC 3895]MDN3425428.1 DUF2787 domain-containing protein [Pseudoalteromonas sp. APC 3896]|tara:strand:+ start:15323 stop:15742 length:420 start_codon:yes stop_codon:yes gene_type:complete